MERLWWQVLLSDLDSSMRLHMIHGSDVGAEAFFSFLELGSGI